MSPRDYVRALRKYWWIAVVCVFLGGSASFLYLERATPVYQGSVTFFATTPSIGSSSSPLAGDEFGQQRVNSYVKLLGSERLADRIVSATGVSLQPGTVMDMIEGEADLNTVLFTAYVRDSQPQRVEEIVGSVAEEFPRLVNDIESQSGTKEPPVELDVVSGPSLTSDPVRPLKRLVLGVGLFLGLLGGVAIALLLGLLDRSVRTSEGLQGVTRVPVLGRIPSNSTTRRQTLVRHNDKSAVGAEAFRQLRTNLQFVDIEKPVSVLVVTSSVAGEGKSTTSANLAVSFADAGKRVLLIDADLRRPSLAKTFGLEWSVGLTNVLAGHVQLEDVVQPWGAHHLHFLASGPIPPNPSELIGSQHMIDLVELARATYDLVIIDTAPLLPVTDGAIAAARADGAVVVVRYGRTRRAEVERAVESLHAVDARVLGTVLNHVPLRGVDGNAYQRYGYSAAPEKPPRSRRRRRRARASRPSSTPVTPPSPSTNRPLPHRRTAS